jgi:hypothetical protein
MSGIGVILHTLAATHRLLIGDGNDDGLLARVLAQEAATHIHIPHTTHTT